MVQRSYCSLGLLAYVHIKSSHDPSHPSLRDLSLPRLIVLRLLLKQLPPLLRIIVLVPIRSSAHIITRYPFPPTRFLAHSHHTCATLLTTPQQPKGYMTYFSVAHIIHSYAIRSGTLQYSICPLVRRKVLKMAALREPAMGAMRLVERP